METSQWKSDETLSLFCFFNEVYMDVCHLFSHWGSLCTETQWFYRRLSDTGRTVFGNVAWPRSAEQTGLFIDILIRYRLACCCQLLTYLHCFSFIYDNISWSQGWCSAHSEHTHTHRADKRLEQKVFNNRNVTQQLQEPIRVSQGGHHTPVWPVTAALQVNQFSYLHIKTSSSL